MWWHTKLIIELYQFFKDIIMSNFVREHLYSSVITFVSTFLLTLGTSFSGVTSGSISTDAILALIVSAARVAGKVVLEALVPPKTFGISR